MCNNILYNSDKLWVRAIQYSAVSREIVSSEVKLYSRNGEKEEGNKHNIIYTCVRVCVCVSEL